jgi:DUF1680 family protein
MKENENTLVATLLMPNVLETEIKGSKIRIENKTNYPNENAFHFQILLDKPTTFRLKIRKPSWTTSIITNEKYRVEDDYIIIERTFNKIENIKLEFKTEVIVLTDRKGEHFFSYGSLFYAKEISSLQIKGKEYARGFEDLNYEPLDKTRFKFIENHRATFNNNNIKADLKNIVTNKTETVTLIPFGKTILRQVSF